MPIPSRSRCLSLMQHASMPDHIQKHSLMVAELSLYLGQHLNGEGAQLSLELLQAGALLHDIAKSHSLATGEHHDELGALMLEEWGYGLLAPIVRDHVSLDLIRLTGPVTESLIVNYADKRVKHHIVVTLEDRFDDLLLRYGKTEGHRAYFRRKLDLYLQLEAKLFERLTISPVEDALMQLSLNGHAPEGFEDYEGQEAYSCFAGRGKIR